MRITLRALFGVALLVGVCLAQEQITLKRNLEPGTYVMTQKQEITSTTNMGEGNSFTRRGAVTMISELQVTPSGDDGQQKIQMQFKRIIHGVISGPGSISYDSSRPDLASPLAQMYGPVLNKPINIVLDRDGKVVSVKGLDEVWDEVAKQQDQSFIAEDMKKRFGNDLIKLMFSTSDLLLPKKPVAVGDTWNVSREMDLPMIGKADLKQQAKLDSATAQQAVISFKGQLTVDEPRDVPMEEGASMKITRYDSNVSGLLTVDRASGMITRSTSNQKSSMTGTMTQQGKGTPISSNEESTVNTTITKGKYSEPATTAPAATGPTAIAPATTMPTAKAKETPSCGIPTDPI